MSNSFLPTTLFCCTIAIFFTSASLAATLTVTNSNDSGAGSLRTAVASAGSGDTIDFNLGYPATITLTSGTLNVGQNVTINGPGPSNLTISGNGLLSGEFPLITIGGPGVYIAGVTISNGVWSFGGGISNSGTLTLVNCTLSGNAANPHLTGTAAGTSGGGAIYNSGTLTMIACTLSGNSTGNNDFTASGGAIYNTGTLTIFTSTLSLNSAFSSNNSANGGAIYNSGGNLVVTDSVLSSNTSSRGSGAGIYNSGTVTLSGSTLTNNGAGFRGGGIYNGGTLTIGGSSISGNTCAGSAGGGIYSVGTLSAANSTLSGNSCSLELSGTPIGGGLYNGGSAILTHDTFSANIVIAFPIQGRIVTPSGIYNDQGGSLTLKSTILADGGGNCTVAPGSNATSAGYNLSDDTSCAAVLTHAGDLNNTPAGLDPTGLQNNGGPTRTIALLSNSPAVDAIPTAGGFCLAADGVTPVTTDQRSVSRPQGSGCDIGALELTHTAAILTITEIRLTGLAQGQQAANYTVTVSNAPTASATNGTVAVSSNLAPGLTLVSMAGMGWSCTGNSCTRNDVLAPGASYPPIAVTVNVAVNASSPLVSSVSVSGGGSATASASDYAIVAGAPAAAPTVVIDAPVANTLVPNTVTISGWALDNTTLPTSLISSVVVKVDGTVMGTAIYGVSRPDVCAAYPGRPGCPNVGYNYTLNTSSLTGGPHIITVSATDAASATGSTSVSVVVTNVPPLLTIESPVAGTVLSGTATISGWAIDNELFPGTAISSVQVLVDGVLSGTATYGLNRPDVCGTYPGWPGCPNVGYSYALNTASLTAGTHIITVKAIDSDGNGDFTARSVSVTVAGGAPNVFIDNPTAGAVLSGIATVSGWAIDNEASVGTPISSVVIKIDGNVVGNAFYGVSRSDVCAVYPGRPGCPNVGFAYDLDTTRLSPGSHMLSAVATDSDGTPHSGTWSVTFQVGTPPTVYIDSLAPGATVSGSVTVSGWAIDSFATIGNVQIKVDGATAGTATYGTSRVDVCTAYPGRPGCPNVGFSYQLNAALLSTGAHVITALATDTEGTSVSGSYSLTVNVQSVAPSLLVYVDSLASGATVFGTVTISGWAIGGVNAIGTVQVSVDGSLVGTAAYGTPRSDVCAAYPGRPSCPNVGFTYQLDTSSLAAGPHNIAVAAFVATRSDSASYSFPVTVIRNSPPTVYVDSISPGAIVSGTVIISGWAIDTSAPIGTVQVLVDGAAIGTATYGLSRTDVCTAYPGRPGCPNVGFTFPLNTASLSSGTHSITVVATDTDSTPNSGSYSLQVRK